MRFEDHRDDKVVTYHIRGFYLLLGVVNVVTAIVYSFTAPALLCIIYYLLGVFFIWWAINREEEEDES